MRIEHRHVRQSGQGMGGVHKCVDREINNFIPIDNNLSFSRAIKNSLSLAMPIVIYESSYDSWALREPPYSWI